MPYKTNILCHILSPFLVENTPPGMNPRKGVYLFKDIKRIFEFHNLGQIKFPEVYILKKCKKIYLDIEL